MLKTLVGKKRMLVICNLYESYDNEYVHLIVSWIRRIFNFMYKRVIQNTWLEKLSFIS